jgi:hypothetical protein
MVFPVSVGGGLRMFPETRKKSPVKLVDTKPFSTGVVVYTYEPATSPCSFWRREFTSEVK